MGQLIASEPCLVRKEKSDKAAMEPDVHGGVGRNLGSAPFFFFSFAQVVSRPVPPNVWQGSRVTDTFQQLGGHKCTARVEWPCPQGWPAQ